MSITTKQRAVIMAKTGGLCWYCGRPAKQIDHVMPKYRGGKNHLSNLVPVCAWCNKSKRHIPLEEWRTKRALALGMMFTHEQRVYWNNQGVKLPPDQKPVFYFEAQGLNP